MGGHKFTKDWKPVEPAMKDDSFADLEKKLAEEMANKAKIGGGGGMGGMGGMGGGGMNWNGQSGYPGQGGQGYPGGFTPNNYYNIDKQKPQ